MWYEQVALVRYLAHVSMGFTAESVNMCCGEIMAGGSYFSIYYLDNPGLIFSKASFVKLD